ncbi:MAG: hypothetical protein QCI82_11450, partial [Candidatus Thermoplasmatota archaeon]|nr:hypothetical protein [Candidatus Thermoplasmatota archaeon]
MTSEKRTNAILSGILILIMVGTMLLPSSLLVSGFSDDGNFFETDDIALWLNFNDDIFDKSNNRYETCSYNPPIYLTSECYDEKMFGTFYGDPTTNYLNYVRVTGNQAINDLSLNDESTDCHIRISLWVRCQVWGYPPPAPPLISPYSLLSKSDHINGEYVGWDLQIDQVTLTGAIIFKLSVPNYPYAPVVLDLDPVIDFGESSSFFYDEWILIRAGWDFFPNGGSEGEDWGIAFLEAIFKNDFQNQEFSIYRDSTTIYNLPRSANRDLYVGRDSEIGVQETNFAGMMDQVQISRGKPVEISETEYESDPSLYWDQRISSKNCSLPHEDMIAYYNFENIEDKASIQYDQNCTMFFDGAHLTPHNGIIEGGTYDPAETTSWDGSTAFTLDGDVYGRVLEDVDGWDSSGGGFMLGGWSKD